MMCISIIFGVNLTEDNEESFEKQVMELGSEYQYGIGLGVNNILPDAVPAVKDVMANPFLILEVHDLPERHCACDIDQDIRNGNRNGVKSKFFDFVRELMEIDCVNALSVIFFQEERPTPDNVRKSFGTFEDFVRLLNRWNTWQVEGFEPTRQAYFVSDESPLLFTFTNINRPN